jgi:hypothetical protein
MTREGEASRGALGDPALIFADAPSVRLNERTFA